MSNKPKILFADIETNGINGFKADLAYALCIGYSWIDEDETYCVGLDDFGISKYKKTPYDDKQLITFIHSLFKKADILAGHYLRYFDFPFLNTRFQIHGLAPLKHLKIIDTVDIGRSNFKLSSNRLKNMCAKLGVKEQKMEKNDGWPLWWHKTAAGDVGAMLEMKKYCKQDVVSNKELFLKLRQLWPTAIIGNIIHKKNNPLPKGVVPLDSHDPDVFDKLILNTIIRTKNACWDWTASTGSHGYGDFRVGGKPYLAHRASFETFKGVIKKGYTIDHLCYNKKCCNPAHLEQVTRGENTSRAHKCGRHKNKDLSAFLAGGINTRYKKGGQPNGVGIDNPKTIIKDIEIIKKILRDTRSTTIIGKEYGVSRSTISRIRARYSKLNVDIGDEL